MRIGFIYKITNKVNGKMYIGQTVKTIKERFRIHVVDSKRKDREIRYPLYIAMREYGEENFYIECIEECDSTLLDEREIFWIAYYDTFHNGYNATLGGSGVKSLDLDEEQVVRRYNELGIVKKVAKSFKCSENVIREILRKNNIKIETSMTHAKEKGLKVQRYSLDDLFMEEYDTLIEAGKWLIDNNLTKSTSPRYAGMGIKRAIIENKPYYGCIWKSDFYDEETRDKRRNKMNSYEPSYKSGKQKNICPKCNKNTKLTKSNICLECSSKLKGEQALQDLNQKITREELKQLIRTTPFVQIGEKFGISDNAIRKWCKRYGLPSKSSEIKKYTNEDWEKI